MDRHGDISCRQTHHSKSMILYLYIPTHIAILLLVSLYQSTKHYMSHFYFSSRNKLIHIFFQVARKTAYFQSAPMSVCKTVGLHQIFWWSFDLSFYITIHQKRREQHSHLSYAYRKVVGGAAKGSNKRNGQAFLCPEMYTIVYNLQYRKQ